MSPKFFCFISFPFSDQSRRNNIIPQRAPISYYSLCFHTVDSGKNLSKHFDISSLYDVFHSSQNELHVCLLTCICLLFPKVSRQSVHYSIKVPITLCPLLYVTTFFMDVKVKRPKNLIIPLLPPSYACPMSGFPYTFFLYISS